MLDYLTVIDVLFRRQNRSANTSCGWGMEGLSRAGPGRGHLDWAHTWVMQSPCQWWAHTLEGHRTAVTIGCPRVAECLVTKWDSQPLHSPPCTLVLGTFWDLEGGEQRAIARWRQEKAFLPGCGGQWWEAGLSPAVERGVGLLQERLL